MKKGIKVIIIVFSALLLIGLTSGVIFVFKNNNNSKRTVSVYNVYDIGQSASDMGYMNNEYGGSVSVSRQQQIWVNEEQKIKEINVQAGDVVKAGDLILTFDSTAAMLALEIKRTEVAMAEASVKALENELKVLENTTPVSPNPDDPETPSDADEDEEIEYTEEELKEAIKAKKSEIKDAQIQAQLMQIEYEIAMYQSANSEVYALFDGVVKEVSDEETAKLNNTPVVTVATAKGYTVNSTIGEAMLTKVKVGDRVSMNSYENGMTYTGVVSEIGTTPTQTDSYGGYAQSYYPVKIALDDETDVTPDMYMNIAYDLNSDEQNSSSIYINLPFVKKEGGNYYIMKDEDGVLVKQYVETGKTLWGSMIEIKSGLTFDDKLAFPYSSDAKEGTKTKEGSLEELY